MLRQEKKCGKKKEKYFVTITKKILLQEKKYFVTIKKKMASENISESAANINLPMINQ